MEKDSWHCVAIRAGDTSIKESVALMNALTHKVKTIKLPPDATAHHLRQDGDHLYYVSPSLARITRDVLVKHEAHACAKKPDLTFARQVDLR